jgi:hypothetical protein
MSGRARSCLATAIIVGLTAAPASAAPAAGAASAQPASAPASQPASARAPARNDPATPAPRVSPRASQPWWASAQAKMGLVLGVVGVGGLVLGAAYGLVARSRNNDALAHCRPDAPKLCDAVGVRLGAEAESAARVSTASFVVGGAVLVTGVVLLLTQPRGERGGAVAPRRALVPVVGRGGGAVMLQGGF